MSNKTDSEEAAARLVAGLIVGWFRLMEGVLRFIFGVLESIAD